jgi:hypothetical protein
MPVNCSTSELINTQEAQQLQRDFDEKYFFQLKDDFPKMRHILIHLVKTTGKFAAWCDTHDHGKSGADDAQVIHEVLPDLLLHALQIANHFNIDLGREYQVRMEQLIKRNEQNKGSH